VRDVVTALERRYPADLADDWDAVGLTCGDPDASVRRILLAVDPVVPVVDEAMIVGADLIITHHPLLLRGVHSIAATTHKGRVVHSLISHGIALLSAHTNADHAHPGVSDALAAALGLVDTRPLVPEPGDPATGSGRVGVLDEPVTLDEFALIVQAALPATGAGIKVAGDGTAVIRTVAVCAGAGDAFLADAAQRADVYVTADLRHHRAQDHLLDGGCALVDVSHWASEWLWLAVVAAELEADLRVLGTTVETHVSTICTDPWTSHLGSSR
jgi:dinuclear metal center YbgI/SA1388 family protein